MAALSDPTPAAPRTRRGHSAAVPVIGLIALISGVAMLLASVIPPDSRSHAIEIPGPAVQRAAAARFAASAHAAEAIWERPLLITTFGQPSTNHHFQPPPVPDRNDEEQSQPVLGIGHTDLEQQARLACNTGVARDALAAMAAAQYRRRSIDSRSCPNGVSLPNVNLVNSDARIANALFNSSDRP